nr:hypothetical protein [Candidatus Thioglobus sp.]
LQDETFTFTGATDPDGALGYVLKYEATTSDSELTFTYPDNVNRDGDIKFSAGALSGTGTAGDVDVNFNIVVTDEGDASSTYQTSGGPLKLVNNLAPVVTNFAFSIDGGTTSTAVHMGDFSKDNDYVIDFSGVTDEDNDTITYTCTGAVDGNNNAISSSLFNVVEIDANTLKFEIGNITSETPIAFNIWATDSYEDSTARTCTATLLATTYTDATGGTITYLDSSNVLLTGTASENETNGTYRVHTFTGLGTFTPSVIGNTGDIDYLIIGAGGTAGASAGGGGGEYKVSYASETSGGTCGNQSPLSLTVDTGYTIDIGAGTSSTISESTTISYGASFTTIEAIGGGKGGYDGGSGGGRASATGCGNDGGSASYAKDIVGGGGGAGGASTGKPGGVGLTSYIDGSTGVCRAGGASYFQGGGRQCGGSGWRGAGTANTGGGACGNVNQYYGGSGIVVIRYQYQ